MCPFASRICINPRLTLWPTGDFGKILSCFTMAFHCLAHDLADWRMASRRSFRDYLRKVFGTLFFFRDCLSKLYGCAALW
uniref:Uncharacterized protein n=1 Tax=Oryza glumipatula TaxID=40148 RepID=A0A0D9YDS5_9ORYZ